MCTGVPFTSLSKGAQKDEHVSHGHTTSFMWKLYPPEGHDCNMQILGRLADRLEYLHAHGYVHRDLKPSTVLWLHQTRRWTLASLAGAARTAEPAAPAFTLGYTAPEVVMQLHKGATTVVPQPAQDVWALGVIAVEMLTGSPAFDLRSQTRTEVRASATVTAFKLLFLLKFAGSVWQNIFFPVLLGPCHESPT
jgi:serine/threonine protein kinase